MAERRLIKNGRVIDPAGKVDAVLDLLISSGKILKAGKDITDKSAEIIDAKGMIVAPGLVDMHCHLREPGREDKETILTGTKSALKGGFTTLLCMPNTEPAIDDVKTVKFIKDTAKKDSSVNLFISGAITKGRLGRALTDFKSLKKEGVIALSDDGASVDDPKIMSEAFKEAKKEDLLLIEHCEDKRLSGKGVMNKGFIATKAGLRGIPASAEYERVSRDIELAKKASYKIHIAHVSCKESVEIIRKAKKDGVKVTAETCPHYFSLTEDCCATYDTSTKMSPPLRTREDVDAVKKGLKDGTIDVIATDHAPHTDSEKGVEFDFAPFGIIGFETALSLSIMELIDAKILTWPQLIEKLSLNPSKILGLGRGTLKEGAPADIVIIDPGKSYTYKKKSIISKSSNSPFIDWQLKGKAVSAFIGK